MRLSWNEIRARAANFARDWTDGHYEKGDTQTFYNDFFEVFDIKRRRVALFEKQVKKLDNSQGFIDLFWPGVVLVEHKSTGRDLDKALEQAVSYCANLKDHEFPRYILVSDFQTFELHDLEERERTAFALSDLPQHIEKFGFMIGVQKKTFRDQDPVNIEASELIGKLHDALEESGYSGHDLEQFLVRIVFCLFADDTGIFEPRDIFLDLLENRTREDGSDLGQWLTQLFQVLDTPEDKRFTTLDEDLAQFPYVNGDLFSGAVRIPAFNAAMRARLIAACRFDWSKISPAIFGSLFQSVMNPGERRAVGAHYTTEKNILKVIEPLFLDALRAEFARLKARRDTRRRSELLKFQEKLGQLTFLDPACGCGNFLIIAYRELRALEIEVIGEINTTGQLDALARDLSLVNVDQFYGIEIGEFAARIAETALWMMDHIMNNRLSLAFGQTYTRIPLVKSPHIRHADALDLNWAALLPPEKCSFVLGNPPFIGQSYQSPAQRQQMARVIDADNGRAGSLDYVGAWFISAGRYIQSAQSSAVKIGFVATNSITQGEQVGQLWPILFDKLKLDIAFAHRTFAWGSDARGKAHVHVVIIGLEKRRKPVEGEAPPERRLFSYPDIKGEPVASRHGAITAYLFDGSTLANPHLVVRDTTKPPDERQRMMNGPKSTDGGFYIFRGQARDEFLSREPAAARFLRPYIGAEEFLQGKDRWILYLKDATPGELKAMPHVMERMQAVKAYRAKSRKPATRKLADFPTELEGKTIPTTPFLVVPQVSSERREYIPIGWMEPPFIPSDKLRLIESASKPLFKLLTSAMHMAWMRTVTGRMKSDYMYSVGVVYNTFPLPPGGLAALEGLEPLAQAVLDARAAHPGATLADLYDPDVMPANLRRAHQALDKAVDKLYRRAAFAFERERVEHLFALYERQTAPLVPALDVPKRRRRTKKVETVG